MIWCHVGYIPIISDTTAATEGETVWARFISFKIRQHRNIRTRQVYKSKNDYNSYNYSTLVNLTGIQNNIIII